MTRGPLTRKGDRARAGGHNCISRGPRGSRLTGWIDGSREIETVRGDGYIHIHIETVVGELVKHAVISQGRETWATWETIKRIELLKKGGGRSRIKPTW